MQADTTTLAPTDAEIDSLVKATYGEMRGGPLQAHRSFARAVLAKWGAPAPVIALLDRIADLEAQLESIGAGGVHGPLIGCASPPTAQAEGWTKP